MRLLLIFIFSVWMPTITYAEDNIELFEKISVMAKKGDMEAAYHLGMFYNNGIGTQKNIKEAYKWFLKSGTANDPLGAYKLGCYYNGQAGNVVEYNKEKAFRYKLFSAKAGYSLAQYDVGLMYLEKGDVEMAIDYFILAAKQGFSPALRILANLYYQGVIVERNMAKAYAYTSLTEKVFSDKMSVRMIQLLEKLKIKMSKEDVKRAQKIIREWEVQKTPLTKIAQEGLQRSYKHAGLTLP